MLIRDAKRIVGGLSKPSKMPGASYGLSTDVCHVGGKLRKIEGSVCIGCYASAGFYRLHQARRAHARRLQAVKRALKSPGGRADFVQAMKVLLRKVDYMRWHDSGDLMSVDHLALICEVARATPHVKHWLPTKELGRVLQYMRDNDIPDNLTIRVSNYMVGDKPIDVPEGLNTCTTHADMTAAMPGHCPAVKNHSTCDDCGCRKCWDKSVKNVSYGHHGLRNLRGANNACRAQAAAILEKEMASQAMLV
jgi:hypothetical protein